MLTAPVMKSHKTNSLGLGPQTPLRGEHAPAISHGVAQGPQALQAHKPHTITPRSAAPPGPHNSHNNEKIALVLALASGFAIWNMFRSIP